LTLLQVQALIVSFSASLLSFTLGLLSRNNLPSLRIAHAKPLVAVQPKLPSWNTPLQGGYAECLLVLAAGMLAASVNSLLLGGLVCGLVIACRILRINPGS
jgi:solute carrier family 41